MPVCFVENGAFGLLQVQIWRLFEWVEVFPFDVQLELSRDDWFQDEIDPLGLVLGDGALEGRNGDLALLELRRDYLEATLMISRVDNLELFVQEFIGVVDAALINLPHVDFFSAHIHLYILNLTDYLHLGAVPVLHCKLDLQVDGVLAQHVQEAVHEFLPRC